MISQLGNLQSVVITSIGIPELSEQAIEPSWRGSTFLRSARVGFNIITTLLSAGINIARERRLLLQEARCLAAHGFAIDLRHSNYNNAIEDLQQSIVLFCQLDATGGVAEALTHLAFIQTHRGQYEDPHRALAHCNELKSESSPETRIWYKLRLSILWQAQGQPRESLNILESLLEEPELSPFAVLRYSTLRCMVSGYFYTSQLSRALGALDLAANLVDEEDYQPRADMASGAARIYLVQSRLRDAASSIHSALYWLHSIHYQGFILVTLHLHIGMYALACGDMDCAQVESNIVLELLRESPKSYEAYSARAMLAQVELCRQSPASCLVHIRSAEQAFPQPALEAQLHRASVSFHAAIWPSHSAHRSESCAGKKYLRQWSSR